MAACQRLGRWCWPKSSPGRRAVGWAERRLRHHHARQHVAGVGHRGAEAALPARGSCPARTRGARATRSRTPGPISWPRRCKAQLDGDQWVLNGQKIWTSAGHLADHIFMLARTDPDAPQAQGDHVPARRHAPAGHRGPPDRDDFGGERVQRGLLHRRGVPEARGGRRRQQRVGCGDESARLRAW